MHRVGRVISQMVGVRLPVYLRLVLLLDLELIKLQECRVLISIFITTAAILIAKDWRTDAVLDANIEQARMGLFQWAFFMNSQYSQFYSQNMRECFNSCDCIVYIFCVMT